MGRCASDSLWRVRFTRILIRAISREGKLGLLVGLYPFDRPLALDLCMHLCFHCKDCVEDEMHSWIVYPLSCLYTYIRSTCINVAVGRCEQFVSFTDQDKLCFILSNPNMSRPSAKKHAMLF
jgi:hypothetical protein